MTVKIDINKQKRLTLNLENFSAETIKLRDNKEFLKYYEFENSKKFRFFFELNLEKVLLLLNKFLNILILKLIL